MRYEDGGIQKKCGKNGRTGSIWEQCPKYPSNLVQAELFLAETYMRQEQRSLAESLLNKAAQTLDRIEEDTPHRAELRQFYDRLLEELTKSQ